MFKSITSLLVLSALFMLADSIVAQTAFWQQTNGPYGDEVLCLAIDSSGYVFAGTCKRRSELGLFRTTNNGDHWVQISTSPDWAMAWPTALAIGSGDAMFLGTYNGVYRSTTSGQEWSQVNTGLAYTGVTTLMISSNGHIFAGTLSNPFASLYRSTDDGNSWIQTSLMNVTVTALVANSSGHLFAATGLGVFRSTDDGATWDSVHSFLPNYVTTLAINSSGHVFAGTDSGIFRSTDNGESWTQTGLVTGQVFSLVINSSGHIYAGTDHGIFLSTDIGNNWTRLTASPLALRSLVINSSGEIFAGTSSGVYRSTDDGKNWTVWKVFTDVNALAINATGDLFAGGYRNVYRSTDNGENWQAVMSSSARVGGLAIAPNGDIYAGAGEGSYGACWGGLYRTTDEGNTWTSMAPGDPSVGAFAINSSGHIFADMAYTPFAGSDSLYRSTDDGATWDTVISFSPNYVTTLAINPSGHIFVVSNTGIFRSTDNGDNWLPLNAGLPPHNITTLAINPRGVIFAGTYDWYSDSYSGGTVFQSTNNGESWTPLYSVPSSIRAMVCNSAGDLFVATDAMGVYRNGVQFNTGLTNLKVTSLTLGSSGYLFAGSQGSGVFRSLQSTTLVKEEERGVPSAFALEQNFPNPFNPTTGIRYQVPRVSDVTLVVYDLLGREIAVLVDDRKTPGTYELNFNGSGLASGVYFYRLTAGKFVETRKMIQMK